MSAKICKLKIVRIGGEEIIAPRSMSSAELKEWFERTEETEIETADLEPVSLTDRQPGTGVEYAALIEKLDYEAEKLPAFL